MEFIFQLSNYDVNCLNEQLSQALENELLSRHKFFLLIPGLMEPYSRNIKQL